MIGNDWESRILYFLERPSPDHFQLFLNSDYYLSLNPRHSDVQHCGLQGKASTGLMARNRERKLQPEATSVVSYSKWWTWTNLHVDKYLTEVTLLLVVGTLFAGTVTTGAISIQHPKCVNNTSIVYSFFPGRIAGSCSCVLAETSYYNYRSCTGRARKNSLYVTFCLQVLIKVKEWSEMS
jgi:hypothetical protein